jgi:hypothetical protein
MLANFDTATVQCVTHDLASLMVEHAVSMAKRSVPEPHGSYIDLLRSWVQTNQRLVEQVDVRGLDRLLQLFLLLTHNISIQFSDYFSATSYSTGPSFDDSSLDRRRPRW